MYGENCKLGKQIQRLFETVPREQVLVIFLGDMKADAEKEYRRILNFLEVEDDGRKHFPVENARAVPRFAMLAQVIIIANFIKIRLGWQKNTGLGSIVYRLNNRLPKKKGISKEMRATLRDYFKKDIARLSEIMDRDLSNWIKI